MLALSLGTVKYVDARPQLSPVPFMSVVNRSVTSRAIEVQIVTQAAEGILSRMFCKFSLMRETAGMHLRRSSAQESQKKRSRKIRRKTTMDRVFETTFLVIFSSVT